jgi:four helix bundle protein
MSYGLNHGSIIFYMPGKIASFEDLIISQKAQELAVKVYRLADTNKFISSDFTLKNQLKSAVISIPDNISEGFEYNNNPDFHRFLRIAKGSCGEIRNKILFVKKMNYIDEITGNNLTDEAKQLGKQIGELIKKVKQKINEEKKLRTRNPTHNP